MKVTQFKCLVCGKITAGRMPRRGDGSGRFPRRHKNNGVPCPGNIVLAEWVDVPASQNAITFKVKPYKGPQNE